MIRFSLILIIPALLGLGACNDANGPSPDPSEMRGDAIQAPLDPAVPATEVVWSVPHRVLFLQRSVGLALIRTGAVTMYDVLDSLNAEHHTTVELWHHGCGTHPYWDLYYDGHDQLVEPNFGTALSEPRYASPEHWKRIFCDADPQYVAARDSIGNFRVVIFKSGYDNTVAAATEQAGLWRQLYRTMKDSVFFRDTTRRIIVLGFPPAREGFGNATQTDADSSRAFNTWLVDEFVVGRGNLYAFPLFDRLAGADNWLRDEYVKVDYPNDSHPNPYGCEIVGRDLMTFIHAVATQSDRPVQDPVQRHATPVD